jgi:hypothetical protein
MAIRKNVFQVLPFTLAAGGVKRKQGREAAQQSKPNRVPDTRKRRKLGPTVPVVWAVRSPRTPRQPAPGFSAGIAQE